MPLLGRNLEAVIAPPNRGELEVECHVPRIDALKCGEVGLLSELVEAPLARVLACAASGTLTLARRGASSRSGGGSSVGGGLDAAAEQALSWRGGMLAIVTDVASALSYLHEQQILTPSCFTTTTTLPVREDGPRARVTVFMPLCAI